MLLQMAYRQGAFPLHFSLKFEWNHMLQNMSCACLPLVTVFDDLQLYFR